jgi:outer membrane biosynthesis protein TonB
MLFSALKKHSGKVSVFIINMLLMVIGVLILKDQHQKDAVATNNDQPEGVIAQPETLAQDSVLSNQEDSFQPVQDNSPVEVQPQPTTETKKPTIQPNVSAPASTVTPTPTPTPAPKPAPAPKPKRKTKTS